MNIVWEQLYFCNVDSLDTKQPKHVQLTTYTIYFCSMVIVIFGINVFTLSDHGTNSTHSKPVSECQYIPFGKQLIAFEHFTPRYKAKSINNLLTGFGSDITHTGTYFSKLNNE